MTSLKNLSGSCLYKWLFGRLSKSHSQMAFVKTHAWDSWAKRTHSEHTASAKISCRVESWRVRDEPLDSVVSKLTTLAADHARVTFIQERRFSRFLDYPWSAYGKNDRSSSSSSSSSSPSSSFLLIGKNQAFQFLNAALFPVKGNSS